MNRVPVPPEPTRAVIISDVHAADAQARANLLYIFAIIFISMLGAVSVLATLYLRPEEDNMPLIVTTFGFLTPTLLFLFTLIKQVENGAKIEQNRLQSIETHHEVNSRMTDMKKMIEEMAFEKGRKEGIAQQRAREGYSPDAVVPAPQEKPAEHHAVSPAAVPESDAPTPLVKTEPEK